MRMTELRALARQRELRGYSKLRKADLIAFLRENENRGRQQPPQQRQRQVPHQWVQQQIPAVSEQKPLTKQQCKCRRAKHTKSAQCFINLKSEINNLKLQMEELKEKISRTSRSAHSGFKRKRIRLMKKEADKLSNQLAEAE